MRNHILALILLVPFFLLNSGTSRALAGDFRSQSCAETHITLADLNRVDDPSKYNAAEMTTWNLAETSPTKGVVLVSHGLNVRPSAMDEIVSALTSHGFHVLRVSLSGHRGNLDELRTVTEDRWLEDMFLSYCFGKGVSDALGLPIYFVGFSLGGLIAEDLVNQKMKEPVEFKKTVYFAPAFTLRERTVLYIESLQKILSPGTAVPAKLNLPAYKANPSTTVAAYSATLSASRTLQASQFHNSRRPSLIYIDPQDELIDTDAISELAADHDLPEWRVRELNIDGSELTGRKYHHLIIDHLNLGRALWQKVTADFTGFLSAD